jgi:glycosyltransferase involved in cell wall biosynthesis
MLSVVIPVLNGCGHIARSIESVRGETVELVVVDDGSTDGTAAYVEKTWREVIVVRQNRRGPSAARNAGARAASGDWITFIDSDDRALPGWTAALSSDGNFGVITVGARLVISESVRRIEPSWIAASSEGARGTFLSGTFAIRRDVLEAVGGFDESMWWGENTELGWRLRDECDRRGLTFKRVDEELIEISRPVDDVGRSTTYAERRATATRQLLAKHKSRFRHDAAARRTQWRIIAVAERQQRHLVRFALAAARSLISGWV